MFTKTKNTINVDEINVNEIKKFISSLSNSTEG